MTSGMYTRERIHQMNKIVLKALPNRLYIWIQVTMEYLPYIFLLDLLS